MTGREDCPRHTVFAVFVTLMQQFNHCCTGQHWNGEALYFFQQHFHH